MEEKQFPEEDAWNVPNTITFFRILITFLIVYLVFIDFNIVYIAVIFVIGMITDMLDGQIARRFNMTTEFGRKFDMVADRFLMIGTVLALVIKFGAIGILTRIHVSQIFLILFREMAIAPFLLIGVLRGKGFPHVRFVGKITTVMQAITFPMLLLSIFYEFFSFSLYFAIATAAVGAMSAFTYIKETR